MGHGVVGGDWRTWGWREESWGILLPYLSLGLRMHVPLSLLGWVYGRWCARLCVDDVVLLTIDCVVSEGSRTITPQTPVDAGN
jgi:hypothetical protein